MSNFLRLLSSAKIIACAGVNARSAVVIMAALLIPLAGCGDDDPVTPSGSDAIVADSNDAGTNDTGDNIAVDTAAARSLSLYVETAKGNALVGSIGSAIFDLSLDKYDGFADPGFQIDVVVAGKNIPDGSDIAVLVGGKAAGTAKMQNGSARIDKVVIPCSSVALGLRVETTVQGEAVGSEKSVLLNCTDACTATLAAVPACISADADAAAPGLQAAFTVTTTTPDCTHAYLKVTDSTGKVSDSAKIALVGGSATVTATLAASSDGLIGQKAQVVAVVEDQAHTDRPAGQSVSQEVQLTTVTPVVAFVAPAGDTLSLSDDADGNPANGVQTTLVGTASTLSAADVGAIDVLVDDVAVATTTLKLNGSFEADLSFAASKTYVVTVRASNNCGLQGEATKSITVIANKAKLTITAPTAGTTLLAKDDSNLATTTVYDTQLTVSAVDATDGDKISIFCRKNVVGSAFEVAPVGSATIAGGAASVDVDISIDLAVFGSAIVCVARDDGANPSASAEHALVIGLPAPCMTIQLPLQDFVTAATSLSVAATATNLEGAVVDATLTLVGGATFIDTPIGKIKNGAFAASMALQVGLPPVALPDGTYELTLNAVDAFGNKVSDGTCSTLSSTFSIDRSPPKLTLAFPTKTVLDPVIDVDSDIDTKGYQTKVTYTLSGEPAQSTSKVCITVNNFTVPCVDVVGNGNIAFSSVSLNPGANVVVAVATDSLGNQSAPAKTNITLQSNAVVVTWTSPASNVVVSNSTLNFQLLVTNHKDGSAIVGATGSLDVDGVDAANVVISEVGLGVYSGTVTGLKTGDSVLIISMTPASGSNEGVSPPLTVTVKTAKPSIALTTFKDGDVINLASTKCVSGLQDCITNIVATTANIADGSAAKLSVQCGKAPAKEIDGTISGNKATFSSVTLTHGGFCTLTASVTDEAAQFVSATAAKVKVDRVAPKIFGLVPAKTTFLASDDFNKKSADGMQYQLAASVAGLSSAATVTVQIFDDLGAKSSEHSANPVTTVEDTGKLTVQFGLVTLPEGKKVKIVVSVTDLAGNATSYSVTIIVISDAAEVRITQPTNVNPVSCTLASQCGAGICYLGKCATGWGKLAVRTVTIVGLGMVNGAKARICSDNGTLGSAAACAAPGMKQVGATTTFDGSSTVISLAALPEGLHTLIAEVLPAGEDAAVAANWVSSTKANVSGTTSRRLIYDATPPILKSVAVSQPADVPAGCLSKASQSKTDNNTAGGSFTFIGTTTFEEATVSILAGTAVVGTANTANKVASVGIKISTEGSVALSAVAVDLLGNQSVATSAGTFNVNTISPIGSFLAPTAPVLLKGAILDVSLGSPDNDVEGQPVVLKDGATTIGSVAMASGKATFADALYGTLTDGQHTLTAILKDECANTATVATIPPIVIVDTTAPTASISSPTEAAVFGDADDASADDGGYQISATFGTGGATKWAVELGTDCSDAFADCAGFAPMKNGNVTADGGNEPSLLVTLPFGKTVNYVLRLVATDANGNVTTVDRGFKVSLSGCLVSIAGLPSSGVVNTSSCPVPNTNCASTKLALAVSYVGPCGTVTAVKLFKAGTEIASAAPTNESAELELTMLDGDDVKVEAKVMVASDQQGTTGEAALKADLTLPVASFIAGTVAGKATPASGTTALQGKALDLDSGKTGHQMHLLLRVTDAGLSGGKLVKLQSVDGSTLADVTSSLALPATFGSNGQIDTEIKLATLAEDKTTTVRATVTDAAGNTSVSDLVVRVDWTAPAAVVLSPFVDGDLNARRPFAKLNFKAVGDDGSTGEPAASYEVVYSRIAIGDATAFSKACSAKALSKTVVPSPGAPGSSEAIVIEGPDPRPLGDVCKFAVMTDNGVSKYRFAVRATDAAGNVGPISNVLETNALKLSFAKITSTTSPWNTAAAYNSVWSVGDVNGDGLGDFGFGGQKNGEKFCVIYGHGDADMLVADLDIKVQSATTHTCFDNNEAFGRQVAGPVDVNGDGIDDLVVSVGEGSGLPRAVHVFLGEKNKPITTTAALKVINITHNGAYGIRALSAAGNFNGDKSASNLPIGDIVFTTRATATVLYDRVMVLPGAAAWSTASPKTIDVDKASDLTANNVLTVECPSASAASFFGFDLYAVGNVLLDAGTDQFDDIAIQRYASSPFVYVVKGRKWTGAVKLTLSPDHDGTGSGDSTTVRIDPPYGNGANRGFGQVRVVSFDGDDVPDLVASEVHSGNATTMVWMRGIALNNFVGKTVSTIGVAVAGSSTLRKNSLGYSDQVWCNVLADVGDFSDAGDKTMAVAYSLPSWIPGGRTTVGVRYATKRPDGLIANEPSYHVQDLAIADPYNVGGPTLGINQLAAVGDFNGDGFQDFIVATSPAGYLILVY